MKILVMHRFPDSFVQYAENIDHAEHDVTYVSAEDRWPTLPTHVPACRIRRRGSGDTATEVLEAVASLPRPDRVVALAECDLLAAAQVREALGVPGPQINDVLLVRDKVVMKSAVASAGLRVPSFALLAQALAEGEDSVRWKGSTLLKPLDGAASEGIRTFPTVGEVLNAVRRGVLPIDIEGFEIEEFVDGPIFHVDGLIDNGKPVAVQASRFVGTPLGYARGRPFGSVQIETRPSLVDWAVHCLHAVGLKNSAFHLEAIETADGPVFMEVGARSGGADIVDTFELATGVRMPSAEVHLLITGSAGVRKVRTPNPRARFGWFCFPGHTLGSAHCRISGEERFRDDPVVWRWVQRRPDEQIKRAITYSDAHIPIAGVIGPAPTPVLECFLTELFDSARVEPSD